MGINATPMMKKVGKTVPAVKMGCQAGKRCCLNALLDGFLDIVPDCALIEGSDIFADYIVTARPTI